MKPSKEQQIEYILKGMAYKLVEEYANGDANIDSYAKFFDVTKEEMLNYIKHKYTFQNLFHIAPSTEDGFYAIPMSNGRFNAFEQERKVKFNEGIIFGIDETLKKFIDYKIVGNGLKDVIN